MPTKRTKPVGLTASRVSSAVVPAVAPLVNLVEFPPQAIRKRVVIERPPVPPVRRQCPYCLAVFDDYTGKPNTIYDRDSCRTGMSRLKRETSAAALAQAKCWPLELAQDVCEAKPLAEIEAILFTAGYHFDQKRKGWFTGEVR